MYMTNDAKMLLNDSKTSERSSVTRRGKQKVSNSSPTISHSSFYVFKISQKADKYLVYYCNKILGLEFQKIAKSGHTGGGNDDKIRFYDVCCRRYDVIISLSVATICRWNPVGPSGQAPLPNNATQNQNAQSSKKKKLFWASVFWQTAHPAKFKILPQVENWRQRWNVDPR